MTVASKSIFDIGKMQSDMFCSNPPVYESLIITSTTIRQLMNMVYSHLVYYKLVLPIESLPVSEKNELWEVSKKIINGRMDKYGCIEVSKVMYAISYYLNN